MVSTPLKNIRRNGNLPQVGVKIKIFETTPGKLVFQFVVQQDFLLILQLPCQKKQKSTSKFHRISASLSILTLKSSYFEDQSANGWNAAPPKIYMNPYTNSINYQPQLVFTPDFSHQQIPPLLGRQGTKGQHGSIRWICVQCARHVRSGS